MIQVATQPTARTSRPQRSAHASPRFSRQERSVDFQEPSCKDEERLHGRIVESLTSSGHYQLRQVAVRVQGNRVSLTGQVSSYYLKQLAQTYVLKLAGARQLQNELVVA